MERQVRYWYTYKEGIRAYHRFDLLWTVFGAQFDTSEAVRCNI